MAPLCPALDMRGNARPRIRVVGRRAAAQHGLVEPEAFPVNEEYLRHLGGFVLEMGRLESAVCFISQALGVTDPGLLSTAIALRKARQQTTVSMPPWGTIDAPPVQAWIDDVLALLRERNQVLHWELLRVTFYADRCAEPEFDVGFICPHDMSWLPTSNEHIDALRRQARSLVVRGQSVLEGLCCMSEEFGLVNPMGSRDGVGSGDVGWDLGITEDDWPGPHRKPGGRSRRKWK